MDVVIEGGGRLGDIQLVLPKAVNMLAEIGRKRSNGLLIQLDAFLIQVFQDLADRVDIVENQAVGDQMIEFNALSLLSSSIVGNDAFSPKERPFRKAIKRLTFVRRRLNRRAQVRIAQIVHQEVRSDHPAQLLKRLIELVLPAVGV